MNMMKTFMLFLRSLNSSFLKQIVQSNQKEELDFILTDFTKYEKGLIPFTYQKLDQ